jgi:hypothetical protein
VGLRQNARSRLSCSAVLECMISSPIAVSGWPQQSNGVPSTVTASYAHPVAADAVVERGNPRGPMTCKADAAVALAVDPLARTAKLGKVPHKRGRGGPTESLAASGCG